MKIIVQTRPGSRQAKIEKIDAGHYRVWVRAVPEKGRANEEMLELLAAHFHVAKTAMRIVMGKTAREKVVEITGVNE